MVYCKSLKYSGNNKIAIIALCPYALLKKPVFIRLLIKFAAATPVHRYTYITLSSSVIALYNIHAIFK